MIGEKHRPFVVVVNFTVAAASQDDAADVIGKMLTGSSINGRRPGTLWDKVGGFTVVGVQPDWTAPYFVVWHADRSEHKSRAAAIAHARFIAMNARETMGDEIIDVRDRFDGIVFSKTLRAWRIGGD